METGYGGRIVEGNLFNDGGTSRNSAPARIHTPALIKPSTEGSEL